ncbi:MAG: hypothetical protein JNL19_11440 [Burkholderiales bacterium]|nr:hypothetical protein [Burkholderiales bacterium]
MSARPRNRERFAVSFGVAVVALALPFTVLANEPQGTICTLLTGADWQTLTGKAAGKLFADEPVSLSPRDVPTLPVALQLQQCSTELQRPGGYGVQWAVMRAPQRLSEAQWRAVSAALESPKSNLGAAPRGVALETATDRVHCTRDEQRATKHLSRRFSIACDFTRHAVSASIEINHEQASALPDERRLSEVLRRLWERAQR